LTIILPTLNDLNLTINQYKDHLKINKDQWTIFYPIRHHSPTCSAKLKETILKYRPEAILIEGPASANHLIQYLVHPDVKAPIALYDYFIDKKNIFGLNGINTPSEEIPYRFHSWHPFADYSPEYLSLKLGSEIQAHVEFIDFGLEDRLKALKKSQESATRDILDREPWGDYQYLSNQYILQLMKKMGSRDFNDLWFSLFEISGLSLSPAKYFLNLFTFALTTRHLTPKKMHALDGTLLREKYMAGHVARMEEKYKRILVITGAYHTVSLLQMFSKSKSRPRAGREAKASVSCLITPYSYFRLSERAGYASGIPYPWYCQQVFEREQKLEIIQDTYSLGGPYTWTVQQLLTELTKIPSTQYYKISTADIIAAQHFAHNLAALRGRSELTPYDMLDAVQSTFLKDESGSTGILLFRELNKLLIGNKVGIVPNNLVQFAIERDFFEQVKKLRLPQSDETKTVKCEIYKLELHRQKSRFLHQTKFLDLEYAEIRAGPDYIQNEQLWLLTEQWTIKWHPEIIPRLIEYASYGATLEEVCSTKLDEDFESIARTQRDSMGQYLIRAIQMGLFTQFEKILTKIEAELQSNTSFEELIALLRAIVLLYGFRESLLPKGHSRLEGTIKNIFQTVLHRIPDLTNISEDSLPKLSDDFRTLSQLINNPLLSFLDPDLLFDILSRTLDTNQLLPRLEGVFLGLLYSFGKRSAQDIEQTFQSYASGSLNPFITPIEFLEGVLSLSKTLIFSSRILQILVQEISKLPDDLFLQLLPGLRRLFTNYIPRETAQIAKEITKYGVDVGSEIQGDQLVLPPDLVIGLSKLDNQIFSTLESWKLLVGRPDNK